MKIIDEATLDLFRGPGLCEVCGKLVISREPHHLYCRGIGSGGRLDIRINLIALCAVFSGGDNCHARAHRGEIKRESLLEIVARREGTTSSSIEEEVWRLRRERK